MGATKKYFEPHYFRHTINLIGLGGVGSFIAEALVRSKLATMMILFDGDSYEEKNLGNQNISKWHVGENKATMQRARLLQVYEKTNLEIIDQPTFITSPQPDMEGIVVMAVDSMSSRKGVIQNCVEGNDKVKLVVDVRMDNEVCTVYCFNPNIRRHLNTWKMYTPDDDDVDADVGETAGTSPGPEAVLLSAALAVRRIKLYARNSYNAASMGFLNRMYFYFDSDKPFIRGESWPT